MRSCTASCLLQRYSLSGLIKVIRPFGLSRERTQDPTEECVRRRVLVPWSGRVFISESPGGICDSLGTTTLHAHSLERARLGQVLRQFHQPLGMCPLGTFEAIWTDSSWVPYHSANLCRCRDGSLESMGVSDGRMLGAEM